MNKLFATALLILGSVCAAQAQGTDGNNPSNGATDLLAASAPNVSIFAPSGPFFLRPAKPVTPDTAAVPTFLAGSPDPADPAAPPAKPRFLYSRNDIVRWELAFGVDWIRFRSSIFNASAVGVKTSLTYFTNEWFGIEGSVSTAFAPEIFDREHVKFLVYGIGPKIAWRERRWEPWMHALVGGAHEQPQTALGGRNAFSLLVGGGADYNFNTRFAGRLEGNYVRTTFFSQSQNNFQLGAGIVIHF